MRSPGWTATAVIVVGLLAVGAYAGNQFEAQTRLQQRVTALTHGGDPVAGREALARSSCGGCHQIPGVRGASGKVGPPLTAFSGRAYIGGRLQNTPPNLISWIVNPHATDPQSAMPPTGVSPEQARDMAAYLYTLR
jgi:mono/diheme cytochrome c family protein